MACQHCGQKLLGEIGPFCCDGCEAVHELITTNQLERYYELRGTVTTSPGMRVQEADMKWLMPLIDRISASDSVCQILLDIQGVHCSGCVWMIEELFRRQPDAVRIVINPAIGRIELFVRRGFPVEEWVSRVHQLGYRLGPSVKRSSHGRDKLLLRTVICLAIAGNAMMLSVALYLGLHTGPVYDVVIGWLYVLGCLSLVVGGPVFFRSSVQALRQGVISFDVPISFGIVLAFVASSWSLLAGDSSVVYFDTISVFVALMLLGRWLQSRILDANRNRILANAGAAGISVRRVRNKSIEFVPCPSIGSGDELLIAPGDLVCVDAKLGAAATLSLDWINGESHPIPMDKGSIAPAGAFNVGSNAVSAVASTDFADSALASLLVTTRAEHKDTSYGLANRIAGPYVIAVFGAALIGWIGWWFAGDLQMALQVTTAVLVVTCPCAFGIATPLAYELAHAGLRRAGLFVRRAGFLDRARAVRKVVFDKTGTLTTGKLELMAPNAIPAAYRRVIYNLVVRSNHPRSQTIRRAIEDHGDDNLLDVQMYVCEFAGQGVEAVIDGHIYRLGRSSWATGQPGNRLVFAVDGNEIVCFATSEQLRGDAKQQLDQLRKDGYEPWIVSGDAADRVATVAAALDIPKANTVWACSPEMKADWLVSRDARDTLFVGDGINDSLIADVAHCSGTPAIDLPFMPARTDFYFTTAGLGPIRMALRAAIVVNRVVRRNLVYAVSYNIAAVVLAWTGWMRPWLAAVLMPASSILIVLLTITALSPRRAIWKS